MYFAVAIRGAVAVQRTSAVRETGASRIQSCDRGRAGTGASSNDCDGGSNYADPIKSRKLWHWLLSWLLGRAGRSTLAAALLLALALPAALLPLAGPAAAQEVVEVPRSWALTPSEISTDGKFRLLFVTSTGRSATSSNIADYNRFVQDRAAAGHADIRSFSSKIRVLGSTRSVDARDNTATTYTDSDKGVPIYWLGGDQVADDYEDFYDGSWDNKNGKGKTESGTGFASNILIWSGTENNGTRHRSLYFGGSGTSAVQLRHGATLSGGNLVWTSTTSRPLFALSPVFREADGPQPFGVSITSTPVDAAAGYAAGETIQVRVDFGEAMTVTGAPYLVLDIAGVARTAVYDSGTGTRDLNFEYTVRAADFDSNGISLCSSRLLDMGCGRITLDGASISAQSDGVAVGLDLPELGNQSGHKVDGMPGFTSNPSVGPMSNPGMGYVPLDWALKPASISREQPFRLLFVSSTKRNATSAAIADYNNHVINAAGGGHSARSGRSRTDSGPSPVPRRWMPGTTPGSPGPGCRSTG